MRKSLISKAFVIKKKFSSHCPKKKRSACELIKIAQKCVAYNYSPPPVVISNGREMESPNEQFSSEDSDMPLSEVIAKRRRITYISSHNSSTDSSSDIIPFHRLPVGRNIILSSSEDEEDESNIINNNTNASTMDWSNHFRNQLQLTPFQGVYLYDVDGKKYLDFLSGYAAVSLGHCHPRLYKAVCDQARILSHTSRAFFTKALAEYGEYITELFKYEKVLPMNTGNDAGETAVKLARKWGYRVKGITPNHAKVLFAENNFWGRSIAAISASTNPESYLDYGPFVPGFDTVPFSDIEALSAKIRDPTVCAFMVEPIQGEAGVVIPDPCYLKHVRELCTQCRVLMIADEVQCGLGRAGCMLCCDIYKVRPDILILGKALSAGYSPVSAVLADADIMDVIEPKTHGSTFGGNALGCIIAMEALQTLQEENLIENAKIMGELLRGALCDLPRDIICEVRGVGLLNALVFHPGINVPNVCLDMISNGLLVATAKEQIIRLCPPLTIKEKEIMKAVKIIRHCVENSRGSCSGSENEANVKPQGGKKINFSKYMETKCPKCSFKLPKKFSESIRKIYSEKV